MTRIILLEDISDLDSIPDEILRSNNVKVFSFNLKVHLESELHKIKHEMADILLGKESRLELFDKGLEFLFWQSKITNLDLELDGVNLLKLFDLHEFHSYFMPNLINFIIIKRVIEKENPSAIIVTEFFAKMVQSIIKGKDVKIEIFPKKTEKKLLWDKILIKYNIGRVPISLTISKNNYIKIKKIVESTIGLFNNFWIDSNSHKKKSIILLEFNSENFGNLLEQLKDYDGNIILVNRRRSALWSKKAFNVIKKSRCKILNFDKILTKSEKQKIPSIIKEYSEKMKSFWENTEFFDRIFQVESCNFWTIIKEDIIKSYSEKIADFIPLVMSVKNLFNIMDVRCIVSLNEIGETERAFLELNGGRIPTILLEHGFIERVNETKRFDKLLYIDFKDKIAVWGNEKKEHLMNEYHIDPSRIIVTGSPRHDRYFYSRSKKNHSKEITVLLAPNPITDISGLSSTNLEIEFENTIRKIVSILKKFHNVKIIVKLHQIQLKHNQEINSIIKKIDSTIPIYSSTPVIETINSADIVIVISSESFGTSTMLMESMILGKPTMNVILDDHIPQYQHVKDKAILTISSKDDLDKNLNQILFDADVQKKIIDNADSFLEKFLTHRGNASENFASILKSF